MLVSRRGFLKMCAASAATLGLSPSLLAALESDNLPSVIWLHGSGCQGDSVSFLNRYDGDAAVGLKTVDEILIHSINLSYHTVLMASAGEAAVTSAAQARRRGGYVLVLEGGVPTAFGGRACEIWTDAAGRSTTFQEAVVDYAADAAAILCVGTCAAYGGISASGSNPAAVQSVPQIIEAALPGKSTINIPGCPAHPDWIAWTVVQLLLGQTIALDSYNRPQALFGDKDNDHLTLNVHENCPRNGLDVATAFGQDNRCLEDLGCRGPLTFADCPNRKWNSGVNWCVDANGMCLGCVEPNFPGGDFYAE